MPSGVWKVNGDVLESVRKYLEGRKEVRAMSPGRYSGPAENPARIKRSVRSRVLELWFLLCLQTCGQVR